MRAIFVTGTDTGVGKTYVCGLLLKYLKNKGIKAVTQKWIQTGCKSVNESDLGKCDFDSNLRLPYIFKMPASPHLAANLEKRRISKKIIINSFKALQKKYDFVIVEGAGGALVPVNGKECIIDITAQLNLPVLLVAQNKLGAINHTLLTIEALRKRKIKILGVVFNNARDQDKKILADNPKIVAKLGKVKILAILPRGGSLAKHRTSFMGILLRLVKD